MDCGIPFCQSGCPVNNIIPDWNDLVYRAAVEARARRAAFDQQFSGVHRARLPGAVRGGVHAQHQQRSRRHQVDRAFHHRQGLGRGMGRAAAAARSRPASASPWSARVPPAWPARSSSRARATTSCVFEKSDRIGGLLRYGIPDFKMEKQLIDRRIGADVARRRRVPSERRTSATTFRRDDIARRVRRGRAGRRRGGAARPAGAGPRSRRRSFRDGIPAAAEPASSRATRSPRRSDATGKHVVVIGGGDTGSDCVGTSNRQGAASVTQFELLPQPPEHENKPLVWPYWPIKLRTSSSHEEGCARDWSVATKRFEGRGGKVERLVAVRLEWQKGDDGRLQDGRGARQRVRAQGRSRAAGDGLSSAPRARGPARRSSVSRATRAATSRPTPRTTRRRCPRSSPPATCGAGSRWSCGRSAKAGSARARSIDS